MRVTLDLDGRFAVFKLAYALLIGIFQFRRLPCTVRRSSGGHGFHVIWRGLPFSQEEAAKWRLVLGDDVRRIEADFASSLKPKQVLFYKKTVVRHGA